MSDTLIELMANYLTEIILGVIFAYGGGFARWIFRTKESREALHSALLSGLNLASQGVVDLARNTTSKITEDTVAKEISSYVKKSVPDAVKFLKASDDQLELMARSYLRPQVVNIKREDSEYQSRLFVN